MKVQDWRRGAQTDPAGTVDEQGVGRRAAGDGEGNPGAGDVLDRELVGAAGRTVVGGNLPVGGREGADTGVLELDPQVVFLEANGVEAKVFAIHAVKAHTGAALDDDIVRDYLVSLGGDPAEHEQSWN